MGYLQPMINGKFNVPYNLLNNMDEINKFKLNTFSSFILKYLLINEKCINTPELFLNISSI